ncbi:MAG: MMPL family transporter [Gammaproteobacteria bacterium]|nr:MMPL family transporter [Gammaproteobacteria bacterium]
MEQGSKIKAAAIIALLMISIALIALNGKVSTELSVFLPEAQTRTERLLHHQLGKGASTNLVFVALSGLEPRSLADRNREMAGKLSESGTFSKITNSANGYSIGDFSVLEQYRYFLTHNNLDEQFSVDGFKRALKQRLLGLSSATAVLEKRYLRQDPTGEIFSIIDDLQGKLSKHKTPEQQHGVWFSKDHSRTLMLLEIKADISDLKNQTAAVEEVRRVFSEISAPELDMVMTGPAAFAVESGEDIRGDVKFLTYLAVFFVVLFLCTVYRSVFAIGLIILPLIVGVVVATACVLVVNDQIHGITLAFGITLAGVTVDYPIHLLTGITSDRKSTNDHVLKIWRTLRLGVVSTVIAYAAFLVSGFGGLQQLGLFTIIGLMSAALFSRWVLPMIAVRSNLSNQGLPRFHNRLKSWGKKAPRYRWVVVGALVSSLVAMVLTPLPILHMNVDSLSPIKDSRRAEGKTLRDDLGFWFGGNMLIATGETKEEVLQLTESLTLGLDELIEKGSLVGYDMAAHFLPSQLKQSVNRNQIKDLSRIESNLSVALKDFPFRGKVFEPFIESLRESVELPLLTPEMLSDTSVGKKLDPLIFDFEDGAAGVILLHGVADGAVLTNFTHEYDNLIFMHLKSAATDLVSRSVDRIAIIMLGSVLLIYACLAYAFKSFTRPFKIMIPTFSAAVVVAVVLVFCNSPLSIFHLISLLLVVGLGLDYALFFNRLPENENEWETTFKSLWVCGITTILVFGILMFSQTPPLRAIGITVGFGAFMSIIFAAIWAATPEKKANETPS